MLHEKLPIDQEDLQSTESRKVFVKSLRTFFRGITDQCLQKNSAKVNRTSEEIPSVNIHSITVIGELPTVNYTKTTSG